ncbi:MAG: sigma-70 family RNA polymerase sigma factor [Acidobacteriota bacterium]
MSTQPQLAALSRDDRIVQHQGLVRHIAASVWQTLGKAVALEDLVGYGQIGLIEAVDRFRPESQCQFSTFAYYRIRGAILDGLCKMRGLSRRMSEKIRFARGFHELLATRTCDGDAPVVEVEQMCSTIEESLHDSTVLFMLSHAMAAFGGDEYRPPEGEALAQTAEWSDYISKAMRQLTEQEAQLVRKVYFEGLNIAEAAEQLGVSRSWASRIHQKAIRSLRLLVQRAMNPPPSATVLR